MSCLNSCDCMNQQLNVLLGESKARSPSPLGRRKHVGTVGRRVAAQSHFALCTSSFDPNPLSNSAHFESIRTAKIASILALLVVSRTLY